MHTNGHEGGEGREGPCLFIYKNVNIMKRHTKSASISFRRDSLRGLFALLRMAYAMACLRYGLPRRRRGPPDCWRDSRSNEKTYKVRLLFIPARLPSKALRPSTSALRYGLPRRRRGPPDCWRDSRSNEKTYKVRLHFIPAGQPSRALRPSTSGLRYGLPRRRRGPPASWRASRSLVELRGFEPLAYTLRTYRSSQLS